jgi:hypothetical protein
MGGFHVVLARYGDRFMIYRTLLILDELINGRAGVRAGWARS